MKSLKIKYSIENISNLTNSCGSSKNTNSINSSRTVHSSGSTITSSISDSTHSFRTTNSISSSKYTHSNSSFNFPNKKLKLNSKNLKISTWNVGGLKACVNKGYCTSYIEKEDPDIMILTQIRCQEEEIPELFKKRLHSYYSYWVGSSKGQGGIGLLTKLKPNSVGYGLPGFPTEEGRLITANYSSFTLICTYVPNSGIKLKALTKRMLWDQHFYNYAMKLINLNTKVIISGDLNVCLNSIDLANPKQNQNTAGFTIEERRNFQDFLDLGIIDTFRYLYPNLEGVYTYWSFRNKSARLNNKGWRLDYHLVSESLMNNIKDCVIKSDVQGSSHCPVLLKISV